MLCSLDKLKYLIMESVKNSQTLKEVLYTLVPLSVVYNCLKIIHLPIPDFF